MAGEFLTKNEDLAELMRTASHAGKKKNVEAILSTEIIGGESGTPKMEAVYFWQPHCWLRNPGPSLRSGSGWLHQEESGRAGDFPCW